MSEIGAGESSFAVQPQYLKEKEKANNVPLTDRSYGEYMNILGISKKYLGKDVLDLGSGLGERFSRALAEVGIKVTSVNPQLTDESLIQERSDAINEKTVENLLLALDQNRTIAGVAQHLPFLNDSFDSVVSVFAVPGHLNKEDYQTAFREISRVLRPGGRAFLAPIGERITSDVRQALDETGIQYSLRKTNKPIYNARGYRIKEPPRYCIDIVKPKAIAQQPSQAA